MTFKHINFYDSPVMRQMERNAISKGLFKTSSSEVEDIVKRASLKKESYVPTEDLFNDIVKLAEGLRNKGFIEDAEKLENKLLEYKVAETHLYRAIDEDGDDVIGAAHPDGEVKIEDAKEGHGIIETQLTQHKKILDIVNKKPSGKYASVIDDLMLDTADFLGVDIKKLAQESISDIWNDKVSSIVTLYNLEFKKLISDNPRYAKYLRWEENGEVVGLALSGYERGRVYDSVIDSVMLFNKFDPNRQLDSLSKFYRDLFIKWANISGTLFKKFISGEIENIDIILGKDKINLANDKIYTIIGDFDRAHNNLDIESELGKDINDSNLKLGIARLDSLKEKLDSIFFGNYASDSVSDSDWNKYDVLFKFISGFDGNFENKIRSLINKQIYNEIKSLRNILVGKSAKIPGAAFKGPVETSGAAIDKRDLPENFVGESRIAKERFYQIAKIYSEKNLKGAADYFQKIADSMNSNQDQPLENLLAALAALSPKHKFLESYNKLSQLIDYSVQYLEKAKAISAKTASRKNGLQKSAQAPGEAEPGYGTRESAGKPVRRVDDFAKRRPREYEAVRNMQGHLYSLADVLAYPPLAAKLNLGPNIISNIKLTGTGKDPLDGKWGRLTEAALNNAQEAIDKLAELKLIKKEKLDVARKYMRATEEDIIKAAKYNEGIINYVFKTLIDSKVVPDKFITKAVTDKPGINIYDQIQVAPDITTEDRPGSYERIPVEADSFTSFSKLATLLRVIGVAIPETVEQWRELLVKFYMRALKQYNADKSEIKLAYIRAIANLLEKLEKSTITGKASSRQLDELVPGAAFPAGKPSEKRPGEGVVYEGPAGESTPEQPFAKNINLYTLTQHYSLPNYNKYSNFLESFILDLDNFWGTNQDNLAQKILKDADWSDILVFYRFHPNGYTGFIDQVGNPILFTNLPDAITPQAENKTKNMEQNYRRRILKFVLTYLMRDIKAVNLQWEQKWQQGIIPERAITPVASWRDRWIKAINNMI